MVDSKRWGGGLHYCSDEQAGTEFRVIEKLISDGSILLIDDLYITWHEELGPAFGNWREVLESLATKLGIQCHSDRRDLQLHMQ